MNWRLLLAILPLVAALLAGCGVSLPAGCPADCIGESMFGRNLQQVDLRGAQLIDANLGKTSMVEANLSGADLSGADLSGATLIASDLSGATLIGAKLNNTCGSST
jgi:uncharacterized protein YjbI with pentapeptide repeats